MRVHKHDWKASEVRAGILGTFEVRLVWYCVRGGCKQTRTEQLKVRKPRPDAISDIDRAIKEQDKRLRKNTASTSTPSPKQPEEREELDFKEWLAIEPMVKEQAAGKVDRKPMALLGDGEYLTEEQIDYMRVHDKERLMELILLNKLASN